MFQLQQKKLLPAPAKKITDSDGYEFQQVAGHIIVQRLMQSQLYSLLSVAIPLPTTTLAYISPGQRI
jgi:hypothetical protein